MRETGAITISLIVGSLLGLIAYLFSRYLSQGIATFLGFLLPFAGFFVFLFIIKKVEIDISHYKPLNWITHFGVIFMTVLTVWLVLINAPFSYVSAPYVSHLNVSYAHALNSTSWKRVSLIATSSGYSMPVGSIIPVHSWINFTVTALSESGIKNITLIISSGNSAVDRIAMTNMGNSEYRALWNATAAGNFICTISIYDMHENYSVTTIAITVQ